MSMKGFHLRSVDRDNDSDIANHIPGNGTARTLHAVEGTFSPSPSVTQSLLKSRSVTRDRWPTAAALASAAACHTFGTRQA